MSDLRMRSSDALLAVSRWTVPPLLAAALVITARVPEKSQVHGVAEVLRAAAVVAGCIEPVVSIRWLGDAHEIEVTCRKMTGDG